MKRTTLNRTTLYTALHWSQKPLWGTRTCHTTLFKSRGLNPLPLPSLIYIRGLRLDYTRQVPTHNFEIYKIKFNVVWQVCTRNWIREYFKYIKPPLEWKNGFSKRQNHETLLSACGSYQFSTFQDLLKTQIC